MPVFVQILERGCGYSQVVSAALVTDKSSGSLVGGLLVLRSICTLTDEPLGGGALTEEKSGPSTTCTVLPNSGDPLDLWVRKSRRDSGGGLFVAGREEHRGGLQRARVVVRRLDLEAVVLQLGAGGGGQPRLAGRVRHLHGDVLRRRRHGLDLLGMRLGRRAGWSWGALLVSDFVGGLDVAFRSFSPGSGSSLMMASKSARMSEVRGGSSPFSSVTPVGTVTKETWPADMPCTDWPSWTRSLVLTLST